MTRGQLLLSTTALGIAIAVITMQVVLSDHLGVVEAATRLAGAALLAIAAALLTTMTPEPAGVIEDARVRPPLPRR